MGVQRHAPASLPPGKTRYTWYSGLGGPQGRSGRVRKLSPPTGIRSPGRPACNESLYRLNYPAPPEIHPYTIKTLEMLCVVCKKKNVAIFCRFVFVNFNTMRWQIGMNMCEAYSIFCRKTVQLVKGIWGLKFKNSGSEL